jgi:cytochrome b561
MDQGAATAGKTRTTNPVSRYHPFLVGLHWLLAVLILAALTAGFWLGATSNSDPAKIGVLRAHMAVGMLILALMVLRFIVRMLTARPAPATTGYPALDKLAPITHYGLYVLILLMVATGYATGLAAGLPAIVFGGSGAPLPQDFSVFPTFLAHGSIALLLVAAIILHTTAAFYHQFVRGDGLFKRMAFGPRTPEQRNDADSGARRL